MEEDLRYIGLEDIESKTGRLIIKENEENVIEGLSASFYTGDVLFGKLRPYLAKAIIAPFNGKGTTELLVMKCRHILDNRFLYYTLLSKWFIDLVDSSTYGAKMPRASWDFIGQISINLPSIDEQIIIANFLDSKTSKTRLQIEKIKKMLELLKTKREVLIINAVTKGLDKTVPMEDSRVEWMGNIPCGWNVKKIKHVKNNQDNSFTDGDWIESKYIMHEGVRLIQTGNIGIGEYIEQGDRYISEESFKELNCEEIFNGDILICRLAAPVGRACFCPNLSEKMITSVDVCILKPKQEWDKRYIVYSLSNPKYLEYVDVIARGSTRQRISRTQLGEFSLSMPEQNEQKEIADYLDVQIAKIDLIIEKNKLMIKKLTEYQEALITAAVTGKIDVRGE